MSENSNDTVENLIAEFRKQAILWHLADSFNSNPLKMEADRRAMACVADLDRMTDGMRSALIPLIQDPDVRVRAFAAVFLLPTRPDLAVPVLEIIEYDDNPEASFVARSALRNHNGLSFSLDV